jgi:hypothetical protein
MAKDGDEAALAPGLCNGVLGEEYWEPLLVLPLEQRRVAGLEPPSERRSVEQPGYLVVSLLHLRRHRAPITVTRLMGMPTQATDLLLIGILLTDIRATHQWPTDTQAIRLVRLTSPPAYGYNGDAGYPDYPGSPSYEYYGDAGHPAYPGSSGYGSSGDLGHPTYPGSPSYENQGHPPYPPAAGPGAGYPEYGYPGDHASEGWSPGTEYPIEPSG